MGDIFDSLSAGTLFWWHGEVWLYISFVKLGERDSQGQRLSYVTACLAADEFPADVKLVPYMPEWGLKDDEAREWRKKHGG